MIHEWHAFADGSSMRSRLVCLLPPADQVLHLKLPRDYPGYGAIPELVVTPFPLSLKSTGSMAPVSGNCLDRAGLLTVIRPSAAKMPHTVPGLLKRR